MNIIVTGANGFVGKNLTMTLRQDRENRIFPITRRTTGTELNEFVRLADFVFHLAGVNRPEEDEEFKIGNVDLTQRVLDVLIKQQSQAPILFASSIQAELDNPYGRSKKEAEDIIKAYGEKYKVPTYIYRLPNLFGKWSKPHYNSVVATFCYQAARCETIKVNDPAAELTLAYIDDVLDEFLGAMNGEPSQPDSNGFYTIPVTHQVTVGEIADLVKSFKEARRNRYIPNMADSFTKKLYSTYLNFLPQDQFNYPLIMHTDHRGSFTEFVKAEAAGQVSINVSKPGITKGDHWHHSKNEKFLVVSGEGMIKLRDPFSDIVLEYPVRGEHLEVVEIPSGYTHSIINTGMEDLVTVMWVNEPFDPDHADTFFLEVE